MHSYCKQVFQLVVVLNLFATTWQFSVAQEADSSEALRVKDRRLEPLKDLNGYFPFKVPESKQAWEQRAETLRKQIRIATGLWPEYPKRTALNPVIHGKVQREGFTVEKVYFESVPNHFVTGLLFRPDDGRKGVRRPAVLCPHGHGGRMQDYGQDKMDELIKSGAEKYQASGRFPKIARCAHLARMGCVTFIFDMLGYEDSQQISNQLAHKFKKQRPEMEGPDEWGFFSAQAELRLQSIMGLQTWNSVRCLDFLEQLPDVDPKRIAVTGGSGGGTQTILLCAIDPRPIAAFPNGMVSTAMQGGCTCENCSLLRLGTGNVELAALFAPKPQAMTSANDWTKDMMTKGYPELQELYAMLGVPKNVYCRELLHFPHNYNYVSRETMYEWFNKHMELGLVNFQETDFEPLSKIDAAVWNEEHPQPKGGEAYEVALTKYLADESNLQLNGMLPKDQGSFADFKERLTDTYKIVIGRTLESTGKVTREKFVKQEADEYYYFEDQLRAEDHEEEVPVVSLYPKDTEWNGDVVLWISGRGMKGVFRKKDTLRNPVAALLKAGAAVMSPELFGLQKGQGNGDEPVSLQRKVENPREAASYSFCYNDTLFSQRVHDVLTLIQYAKNDEHAPKRILLVGTEGAGPISTLAKVIAGSAVSKVAIDTEAFRFEGVSNYLDENLLPGAVKFGDFPVMLALCAPESLQVVGEDSVPKWTRAAFESAGSLEKLKLRKRINVKSLLAE